MRLEDVDPVKEENGDYCRKKCPGCFCAVGWPYELQCPDCRDGDRDKYSYCVCPPPEKCYVVTASTPWRLVWDFGDSFGSKLIFNDMIVDKSGRVV
jgi:hypothetical protein